MNKLPAREFLNKGIALPIIDVRSPKEFEEGHIPGAINIAIFNNEERAEVGTIYKKIGKQAAILKGLEIVGPKMANFAKKALKVAVNNQVLIHCWRGGMRSESMAWLFQRVGIQCSLLEGGYKAYRNHIFEQMTKLQNLIILKGLTGSGKTEILLKLAEFGEQIIDLEGLANHKGSTFGGVGQPSQPSTQQFHNNLFDALSHFNKDLPIWIEGESKAIGKVFIPDSFWESMFRSRVIEVHIPLQDRVNRLVKEYSELDVQAMESSIMRLEKRLGNEKMNYILNLYKEKEYAKVSQLLLEYYDKTYKVSIAKNEHKHEILNFTNGNVNDIAQVLLKHKTEIISE